MPIVLGAGRMLAEFETGLHRLSAPATQAGESACAFPTTITPRRWPAKTAQFEVGVKKVEEQELPALDEDFCAVFGISRRRHRGSCAQEVRDNMGRELEQTVRARIKTAVLEQLLAANPLELPRAGRRAGPRAAGRHARGAWACAMRRSCRRASPSRSRRAGAWRSAC